MYLAESDCKPMIVCNNMNGMIVANLCRESD